MSQPIWSLCIHYQWWLRHVKTLVTMIVTYSDHINDINEYSSGFMFPHQFSVPLVARIALEGCDAPRYGDPDYIPVIEAVQVQYLRLTELQREQRHGRRGRRLPGHLGEVAGRTPTLFRNAQTMQTFLLRRIRLLVEQ